jgi:hypothetical protein
MENQPNSSGIGPLRLVGFMAIEKKWAAIAPVAFIASGSRRGRVTIASTAGFRVKMEVAIGHPTLPTLLLEVKRVLSATQMDLGDPAKSINDRTDLSAYDFQAYVFADEQIRPDIPLKEIERALYEEEPVVAKRVVPVNQFGQVNSPASPSYSAQVNALVSDPFDTITVTAQDANSNPTSIAYSFKGNLVATLTITYDANGNFQSVAKS